MGRTTTLWAVLAAIAVSLVFWGTAPGQITKGKKRPAGTNYLMRGINLPNCAGLGKALKEAPASDKAWDTIACQASCLNEMSYVLMDDGRCPDATWAKATKALRDGSAAVVAAAQKKDVEAARAAFKTIAASCATCHKAHRSAK
ncbi:MAG: cytochrome c [Gemmataceae bacterium]|nr:cytochrome c [Gemmataceae bacterium]